MTKSTTRTLTSVVLGLCLGLVSGRAPHAQRVEVPLTPDRWEPLGSATMAAEFREVMGSRAVVLKSPIVLKDLTFRNGTIELDVDSSSMGAGLGFRSPNNETAEILYFRPKPNCAQAFDCAQYTPLSRGVLLWDMFPQHQAPAPFRAGTWNHVKVVVSGQRMRVFVNKAATPTLEVGRLEGDAMDGRLVLLGPGSFANLTVTPNAVEGLAAEPEPDSTAGDGRFVRLWQIAPAATLSADTDPAVTDLPGPSAAWRAVAAERGGLINISRLYGKPVSRPNRNVTWLKTTIASDAKRTKKASIGWTREVWVFVNGRLVYANKNVYDSAAERKQTDGRLALDNGSFVLPLEAGDNQVAVAIASDFYGWGVMLRLDDLGGVKLANP